MNFLQPIGRVTFGFLAAVGRLTIFTIMTLAHAIQPPFYFRIIGRQMLEIGYFSLPVIGLTAIFAGMVIAIQSFTGFARFNAEGAVANSNAHVALSTTGIAGPGGAVPGKPVGTVCFAWSRDGHTHTERLIFQGDRQAVRRQTVIHSLQGLLKFLA